MTPFPQHPNSPSAATPRAYRVEEAMRLLGVGRTMIYALVGADLLPVLRLGRCTLIQASDLQALLKRPQFEIDAALAAHKASRGVL